MKKVFLQAQEDAFWGLTESQMHTMTLRAGVIIPNDAWANLIAQAKAYFFVSPNEKGLTKNSVVNIAIKMWLNKPLHNCFAQS